MTNPVPDRLPSSDLREVEFNSEVVRLLKSIRAAIWVFIGPFCLVRYLFLWWHRNDRPITASPGGRTMVARGFQHLNLEPLPALTQIGHPNGSTAVALEPHAR